MYDISVLSNYIKGQWFLIRLILPMIFVHSYSIYTRAAVVRISM